MKSWDAQKKKKEEEEKKKIQEEKNQPAFFMQYRKFSARNVNAINKLDHSWGPCARGGSPGDIFQRHHRRNHERVMSRGTGDAA